MIDRVIRHAHVGGDIVDIGIEGHTIAAIAPGLVCDAPEIDAQGCVVVPGLVETHIHLDKTCILDRCAAAEGSVAEAVRETARVKAGFTEADVFARGERTLRRCICHGTTRMRTHVELDPRVGMRGFDGVAALAREYAWAIDIELCVFPQEGLLDNPGTDALLVTGLQRGARVIGAAPYIDRDPRGQIDRVFELAREFDVDIDMHLDLGETNRGMQTRYVCDKTDAYGWGGRVTVGHVTQLAYLPPTELALVGRRLADSGVAVTVLPSTDLYLTGRAADHAKPRGVLDVATLRTLGVTCSVATNNVLNPFTPYGDGSLVRMANLYANVCHVGRPDALENCFGMVTHQAARLMRLDGYGVAVGAAADLVAFDAASGAQAIAEIAPALWGMKAGRVTFQRPRAMLLGP